MNIINLETKEILKSINGYDIVFSEKRCLYFFFSKRSSKANRLRYRILYNLEDVSNLPENNEFIELDKTNFPVVNVGYNTLEIIMNRNRTVVYLPSGKMYAYKEIAPCLIDIISL